VLQEFGLPACHQDQNNSGHNDDHLIEVIGGRAEKR